MKSCFLGQCCNYSGCLNINGAIKQAGGLVLEARETRQQGAFFFLSFFLPAPEDHLPGRAFSVITNFFFTHYASVFRINRTVDFWHSLKVAM